MDIDPDISNWILDFLLRQPLHDRTLNALLHILPLPDDKPNLKVLLLLKKLQSDAISLSALEILEQLEEVLFYLGKGEVLESMKRAYCAVAVKCTVESLTEDEENDGKFKFFEVVKSVWRERIGRMQKSVEGGLGSKELWDWKDEIEAAVWEDIACDNFVKKCKLVNAVAAVDDYIREERERLGPPFIQLVANCLKDEKVLKEVLGTGKVAEVGGNLEISHTIGQEANNQKSNLEVERENFQRRSKRTRLDYSRGIKIVDSEERKNQSSNGVYKLPCSAEVQRVQEALVSSSLELQATVKDPLPEALQLAEALSPMKGKNDDRLGVADVEVNVFHVDSAGVVQGTVCNMRKEPKTNLMERNRTARTHEWSESIDDDSSEEQTGHRGGLRLPSPRNTRTSPLKKYDVRNLKKRKIRKKWSPLEEDTLRSGVERFGRGNWKVILTFYHDIFVDRTEVDLKDKWRNLTRY